MTLHANEEKYLGFEQGPIRPPSESNSLLIRVTRNCPWNRCAFCGLYQGEHFSQRPVAHVVQDIWAVRAAIDLLEQDATTVAREHQLDPLALQAARHWGATGMRSVFLQDSNSLVVKPEHLTRILKQLRSCFPSIKRITSYARARTVAGLSKEALLMFAAAGLNRLHIGLESGSDKVLALVLKGVDQQTQILAGQKVKAAGIELSEYYMPGLGGEALSEEHAAHSAETLSAINPDFIRLRTLALPDWLDLAAYARQGRFKALDDMAICRETLFFLRSLKGVSGWLKSDHILNLFEELDGKLPDELPRMIALLEEFLSLAPQEQVLYQIGRRRGVFRQLNERLDPLLRARAQRQVDQLGARPDNVGAICSSLLRRFI